MARASQQAEDTENVETGMEWRNYSGVRRQTPTLTKVPIINTAPDRDALVNAASHTDKRTIDTSISSQQPSFRKPQRSSTRKTSLFEMSWQAYVDTSLVGTGYLDKASIFSAGGDSQWATSHNFHVKPEELKEIVSAYKDTGEVKKVQSTGLHVAGEKFVIFKADDRSIYGRKGKEGLIIVKTTQAILICHYPEHIQTGSATTTVEQLADYLISVGY